MGKLADGRRITGDDLLRGAGRRAAGSGEQQQGADPHLVRAKLDRSEKQNKNKTSQSKAKRDNRRKSAAAFCRRSQRNTLAAHPARGYNQLQRMWYRGGCCAPCARSPRRNGPISRQRYRGAIERAAPKSTTRPRRSVALLSLLLVVMKRRGDNKSKRIERDRGRSSRHRQATAHSAPLIW